METGLLYSLHSPATTGYAVVRTTAVGAHVLASTWTTTSGGSVTGTSTRFTERPGRDRYELEIS